MPSGSSNRESIKEGSTMQSTITEIAPDTYRISTFHPDYGIQFNQFLIKDDEPFLMHTGFKKSFQTTLDAVSKIIAPADLKWIGFSHFEPDECGALNEWLAVAPRSQAVCSVVGAIVCLNDFADRAPRPLADGEILEIGRHRLRFLATPHVPHAWDAGLFFDEAENTLLCSDLFFQPGEREPLIESGIVDRARDAIQAGLEGPLSRDLPYTAFTDGIFQRLAALEPTTLAVMHGSSYRGDGRKAILDLAVVVRDLLSKPDGGRETT
jgi:flavorubredoxin